MHGPSTEPLEERLGDRRRLDEMAALRARLAASVGALEDEVARLHEAVAAARAPLAVPRPVPAVDDWELPPLDPAWQAELDALVGEPLAREPEILPAPAAPRERRRVRRPSLPAALFVLGSVAVADAVLAVTWQEPVTALYAGWQQGRLDDRLETLERPLADTDLGLPDEAVARLRRASRADAARTRMVALAARMDRRARPGQPIGRLRIPRLGKSAVVVEGTGGAALRTGPGHYTETGLPGTPGAVFGVAGHRTSWSAPFRRIDALRRGDAVIVTMPYGRFVYRVATKRIVRPEDVWVLQDRRRSRLVLTACHPLFSAAKRIVVSAELERATPRGAALRRS